MVYIYNPGAAPHHIGSMMLPAKQHRAVTEDEAKTIRDSGARILFEGMPDYPELWVRREGQSVGP